MIDVFKELGSYFEPNNNPPKKPCRRCDNVICECATSNCCGAMPVGNCEDYGICPDCKEHCEFTNETE